MPEKVGTAEPKFYKQVLASNECQCGEKKKPGWALCWSCFQSLPQEVKKGLYQKVGAGFEQAYELAIVELKN